MISCHTIAVSLAHVIHSAEQATHITVNRFISFHPIQSADLINHHIPFIPLLAFLSLGCTLHPAGLPPTDAIVIFTPLENARRRLILRSGFHLVFLVTPTTTNIEPNWSNYENIVTTLYRENKVNESR